MDIDPSCAPWWELKFGKMILNGMFIIFICCGLTWDSNQEHYSKEKMIIYVISSLLILIYVVCFEAFF